MGKRSRRPVSGRMVSASDLAQMGRCERLVVFEHLMEERAPPGSSMPGRGGWSSMSSSIGKAGFHAGHRKALLHRHLRVRRGLADGGAAPVQGRGACDPAFGDAG